MNTQSVFASAIFANSGAILWHGPHHVAVKSTTTSCESEHGQLWCTKRCGASNGIANVRGQRQVRSEPPQRTHKCSTTALVHELTRLVVSSMSGRQTRHDTTRIAVHLAAGPGKDGVKFGLGGDLLDHGAFR